MLALFEHVNPLPDKPRIRIVVLNSAQHDQCLLWLFPDIVVDGQISRTAPVVVIERKPLRRHNQLAIIYLVRALGIILIGDEIDCP